MQTKVKLLLACLVAIVAGGAIWFELERDLQTQAYMIAGTAALMIVSMWIFPEVTKRG
jgi:hypothetical protein